MGKGKRERRAMEICLYSAQAVGIKGTLFCNGEYVPVWKLEVPRWSGRTFKQCRAEVVLYHEGKIRLPSGTAATDGPVFRYWIANA